MSGLLYQHLKKQSEYDFDSNSKVLAAIVQYGVLDESVLKLFSHLLVAQRIWLSRVIGSPTMLHVWQLLSLEEMKTMMLENKSLTNKVFALLGNNESSATIYQNNQGQTFENCNADILQHLYSHGVYHRAQIASRFRAIGLDPVVTDYIFYVRQQEV